MILPRYIYAIEASGKRSIHSLYNIQAFESSSKQKLSFEYEEYMFDYGGSKYHPFVVVLTQNVLVCW